VCISQSEILHMVDYKMNDSNLYNIKLLYSVLLQFLYGVLYIFFVKINQRKIHVVLVCIDGCMNGAKESEKIYYSIYNYF